MPDLREPLRNREGGARNMTASQRSRSWSCPVQWNSAVRGRNGAQLRLAIFYFCAGKD
jgi:hypothetical protein